ncbi:Uncharacterised protein [Escherichia coli]|uniref:Uncharacterized protein n=1 Tax=Escherichia coli TaxID=562 RepID=A0A376WTA8_ECOLX|nr:Uncharacterised protein [Escherichia coli]
MLNTGGMFSRHFISRSMEMGSETATKYAFNSNAGRWVGEAQHAWRRS